jgi:hypothetical protein
VQAEGLEPELQLGQRRPPGRIQATGRFQEVAQGRKSPVGPGFPDPPVGPLEIRRRPARQNGHIRVQAFLVGQVEAVPPGQPDQQGQDPFRRSMSVPGQVGQRQLDGFLEFRRDIRQQYPRLAEPGFCHTQRPLGRGCAGAGRSRCAAFSWSYRSYVSAATRSDRMMGYLQAALRLSDKSLANKNI